MGKCWSKSTKFHLCKRSSGDLLYNIGHMMNNTVLYTLKLAKRVDLMLSALTTKGKKGETTKELWEETFESNG